MAKHLWKKGESGNPTGKNAGRKPFLHLLKEIDRQAKSKKGHLIKHAINRAYKDDRVLIAILKKIIPDKIQGDLDLGLSFKEISNEFRKFFKQKDL